MQYGRLPTQTDSLARNTSCDNCGRAAVTHTRLPVTDPAAPAPARLRAGVYYVGLYSAQCCAPAEGTVAATLVSCSAACHSGETAAAAHFGACIPGCDALWSAAGARATSEQPRYNAHWLLYHTIPCARVDCAAACRARCGDAAVTGSCNPDPGVAMCECHAVLPPPGNTSGGGLRACLRAACAAQPGWRGAFAGAGCGPRGRARRAGGAAPAAAVLGGVGVLLLAVLALMHSPRLRRWAVRAARPTPRDEAQEMEAALAPAPAPAAPSEAPTGAAAPGPALD